MEKISEDETWSKHTKLEKGDLVIVKYETSKRDIMYMAHAQVEKEEKPLIKVNILTMKNNFDGTA